MNKLFTLSAMLVAVGSLLVADVAMAQPGGGGGRGGQQRGGFAGMGGGDNMLGLLASEQVQNELELVDDQIEELKALRDSSMQAMRDVFQGMGDLSQEERREKMGEMQTKIAEKMKELEEEANKVLLPHQKARLKQITYQSSGRNQGAGASLGNEDLLDELGVSEDQRKKLEEATAKAREQLQEKYKELVRKAEEDILKVLTKEQRAQYLELVGEPFEMQNRGGFGGGRGGQQGGRGGDGGGDRGGRGGDGGGDRSDFQD